MNDPAPRVVTVGDLTADLIVEVSELPIRAEDFQEAGAMRLEPGGSANLLILLARLGASAVALGTLGKDLWGEQVFQILKIEGVELSTLRRGGTSTVALVLVNGKGRHSFVGSYGKGERLTFGDRERQIIAGANALFASGYSLAESRLQALTLDVLEAAGQRTIPRFFDPGPAFRNLQPEVQRRVLALSDVLLLTEEELRDLSPDGVEALLGPGSSDVPATGRAVGTAAKSAGAAAAAVPGAAQRYGKRTVVVKRGPAGCRVYTESAGSVDIPGLPVTVRDTTVAGDCFDAGYIWAHLKGRSPEECALLANCAGAAAVRKLGGGRNVPTVEELKEMLAKLCGGIEI